MKLRRWPVLRAIAVVAVLASFSACAPDTQPSGPSLPRDEAARSAIAAIARTAHEAETARFVESRRPFAPAQRVDSVSWAPPDIAAIVKRHEIRVAMLGIDNAPFFWHDASGRLTGLDVLLARALAASLGVSLRIDTSATTFDGVIAEVREGRADLGISKLSRTLGRAQSVTFSKPYVELHRAFLANRVELARYASDRQLVPAIQHFSGKLGVIAGSSYETYAHANFPASTLVRFATWAEEVQAVRRGAVVAGFRDELEVNRVLDGDPGASLTLRSIVFNDSSDTISIAVPWQAAQLRLFVDVFLESHQLERLPASAILFTFPAGGRHA